MKRNLNISLPLSKVQKVRFLFELIRSFCELNVVKVL